MTLEEVEKKILKRLSDYKDEVRPMTPVNLNRVLILESMVIYNFRTILNYLKSLEDDGK